MRDYIHEAGAKKLKEQIEAYWWMRGKKVNVRIEKTGFLSSLRGVRADVRSDMVNGLPSCAAKIQVRSE